jgi:hypothetical protein
MKAIGTITLSEASYKLHSASYDDATRTAIFFATIDGKHTGDGGPVPPTNQEMHSDYVYAVRMDASDRVSHVTKIWNAPWAMRQLGWAD